MQKTAPQGLEKQTVCSRSRRLARHRRQNQLDIAAAGAAEVLISTTTTTTADALGHLKCRIQVPSTENYGGCYARRLQDPSTPLEN